MMNRLLTTVLLLIVLAGCGSLPTLTEPDAGGLDLEPGLRLRVYWVGEDFDKTLPLQPGQSPNIDRTVPTVSVEPGTVFRDDQGIIAAQDETVGNHYIAEWTGWIKAPTPGRYDFYIGSDAQTDLTIGGVAVERGASLEPGWYPIRLTQRVTQPDEQAITLTWTRPGEDNRRAPYAIDQDHLRAPAFYFRPTQSGKKALADGSARPGLGKKLTAVHPGYRLTNIRPGGMEMPVGGLGMLPDGRLVVARFDATTLKAPRPTEAPNGQLWLISNPAADDPAEITGEMIVDGLYEPSGVAVLGEAIYVSHRHAVLRYTYNDETGAWDSATVAAGWTTNDFHQISVGLPHVPGPTPDHPGFFYLTRGAALGTGVNPPDHAAVWLIDLSKPAGENVEVISGGHRTPNGIGLNTAGEPFVIDNQGGWTPVNELNHVQKGKFYGFYLGNNPDRGRYPTPFQPEDRATGEVTEAAVKLPQDEIGNSPTQPLLFPDDHRFAGQFALGDMRYGGVNRVFLEEVNGVWQGCVLRFTQGLEAGPNRLHFGPDGALYIGSIGGKHGSTWSWQDARGRPQYQGLERLTPTGEDVFEIESMSATPDGFVLSFTQPVPIDALENNANYRIAQWTYVATNKYGGPKIDEHELNVFAAVASDDRRSVRLMIPGLKPGYVVKLTTDPVSDQGRAIWSGEVWYTLNQVPAE